MTTTYSGPARLILVDGARISGMASLTTNQRAGLHGWGGMFRPDEVTSSPCTALAQFLGGLNCLLPCTARVPAARLLAKAVIS
jgi:hypothetical protein